MNNKYTFLPIGSISYEGTIPSLTSFINQEQLLNEKLWSTFVKVFKTYEVENIPDKYKNFSFNFNDETNRWEGENYAPYAYFDPAVYGWT